MGCGSSSLKGEKVTDIGADSQPARKVKTNFSDVDFSSNASGARRGTMAVAPDEERRPTRISEASVDGAPRPHSSNTKKEAQAEKARQGATEGAKLEPYKTLDGETDGLASPTDQAANPVDLNAGSSASPEIHVAPGRGSHEGMIGVQHQDRT